MKKVWRLSYRVALHHPTGRVPEVVSLLSCWNQEKRASTIQPVAVAGRTSIETLNRGYAWLKRHQRYEPPPGVVKVNLGSGLAVAPSWINIDLNVSTLVAGLPAPLIRLAYQFSNAKRWTTVDDYVTTLKRNKFVHHNLVYCIPLPDESSDYVYSAHFLEHLYRDDAEHVLREAYRILKPNGVLRINVPNLDSLIAVLNAGDTERALEGFFPRSAKEDANRLGRHRYMYDFNLLVRVLKEAGFTAVERCDRRQGAMPDLSVLEHRSEHGLYVEARR